MSEILFGILVGVNLVTITFAVPLLIMVFNKKIKAAICATEVLKNTDELIEVKQKIKELEDMNQKMSKYLDTVENRLQNLNKNED